VRGESSALELRGEGAATGGMPDSQRPGALPSFEATMRFDHVFEQGRAGIHADSPGMDVVGDRKTLLIARELVAKKFTGTR